MSLCKEFVALTLANGLNTSALCRLERFRLGPTHDIHRSQGAKCVTHVPEQLLPMSPVCTLPRERE